MTDAQVADGPGRAGTTAPGESGPAGTTDPGESGPAGGTLRVEVRGATGWIVIDHPAKRNAMTPAMWAALPGLLDALAGDDAVRSVVLTGRGGTFCAGADISQLGAIRPQSGPAEAAGEPDAVLAAEAALITFPKPTLAVVDGFCVGGGCQLAAACDLRFATDRARFGITPAKLGIVYPASSLRRLTTLVGPAAAKLMLFGAELLDAAHALRIGLVDEVHLAAELPGRVEEFTATLASRSQLTQLAAKDVIDRAAAGEPLDGAARFWEGIARDSGEAAEGIAAFLERRPPTFPWHPGRPPAR